MRKVPLAEYEAEIRARFDWERVVTDVEINREQDPEDRHQDVGTRYLGSVFTLTPSGKIYTPWANGNVERCHSCHGSGSISPKSRRRGRKWQNRRIKIERLRRRVLKQADHTNKRARVLWQAYDAMSRRLMASCRACEGMGSVEALNDQTWAEALENVASDHGLFVTSNDGDGDGIWVAKSWPHEDEDDELEEDDEPEEDPEEGT